MLSMSNDKEGEQLLVLIHPEEESQQKDCVEVNCTNVMLNGDFCSRQQDCKPFFTLMENDTDDNDFDDIVMKSIEETEQTLSGEDSN